MRFRIEIITDVARFQALREPWQDLWRRSNGRVFQSHDWLNGWLTGVGDRKDIRLQICLARDGDQLVAAMPCAIHRRTGLRVLSWAAQLFSDYCDCLLDPGQQAEVLLPLLWDSLKQSGGFDLISLQQVRPDAVCRRFFDTLAGDCGDLQTDPRAERCMGIRNEWHSGEAFFRSLNKKGRNNHTRGKRILSELGGDVAFRVIEPEANVNAVVDEILRLKHEWLRINDPASLLLAGDGPVLRSVIDRALAAGLARIFLLECGGKIAAASINFVYAGRMEAYLTSYDAAFERASPGTILIVEYAQWSFDRGLSLVDFLRGEEPFKFRLANTEAILASFSGSRTIFGHVAMSGHRWLAKRRQRREPVEQAQLAEAE